MNVAGFSDLRPPPPVKRVKLVSTCDTCKNRKVKCDRVRPKCGTCKKTGRECGYKYSDTTHEMRESGARSRAELEYMKAQVQELMNTQFNNVVQMQNCIAVAVKSAGVDMTNGDQIANILAAPDIPLRNNDLFRIPGDSALFSDQYNLIQHLAAETLSYSTEIAAQIDRDKEQRLYDPHHVLNYADFAVLAQQQVKEPQGQTADHQSNGQTNSQTNVQGSSQNANEDVMMEELVSAIDDLTLYQSTRYIGEGSLLLIGSTDDNGEKFITEPHQCLAEVEEGLRALPTFQTAKEYVDLYLKHVHRYTPFLRRAIFHNALNGPLNPQHLLILNCIFFAAAPFHHDPEKSNGRVYFERAEALLYKYCRVRPHVLTVMATVLLSHYNKDEVAKWMYNGIGTKMLFELGLHRKIKNVKPKIAKEVERLRDEAFWMIFISENFISAAYGRPNMIEESDCDIDVPSVPQLINPLDDETRLHIAFIHLITLSRLCVKVRKYLHAASRLRPMFEQEDKNKFRLLDLSLSTWHRELPPWLQMSELSKDENSTLLNGIGGDLHLFYGVVLILLHSRYLKPPGPYSIYTIYPIDSPQICTNAATTLVNWLQYILEKSPDFFALAICGVTAINPAMRVFRWNEKYDANERVRLKASEMIGKLEYIRQQTDNVRNKYDRGRLDGELGLNIEQSIDDSFGRVQLTLETIEVDISRRDYEVYVNDDDFELREQYRRLMWRQRTPLRKLTRPFRSNSRAMSGIVYSHNRSQSGSRYDNQFMVMPIPETDLPNFVFTPKRQISFGDYQPASDNTEGQQYEEVASVMSNSQICDEPGPIMLPEYVNPLQIDNLQNGHIQEQYLQQATATALPSPPQQLSKYVNPLSPQLDEKLPVLPMTPPHQQYADDLSGNEGPMLCSQPDNPARTFSNSSNKSVMLTPPQHPLDFFDCLPEGELETDILNGINALHNEQT